MTTQTILPDTTLPNTIVIGAPRSGTTSLFFYLQQHPQVFLPTRKELHYFTYNLLAQNTNGPGDQGVLANLCATPEEYASHYRGVLRQKVIAEISPSYLYYSQVSERIHRELGQVKIIALLRNPIEKAYSQYMHMVRLDLETLPFYEALMAEGTRKEQRWSDIWRYAEGSLYSRPLEQYLSVFGRENVKVLLLDDLVRDPEGTLQDLFRFLEIDETVPIDASTIYNRSGTPRSKLVARFFARPNLLKTITKIMIPERIRVPLRMMILNANSGDKGTMPDEARRYLTNYLRDDVERLEALLGQETGWRDTTFMPQQP